ncbi:MAG: sulfatase-like hydrolase/transferase [Kiritimatiellaeota bacterium]|nr:sulfatase-like hydrolase/transferase [Kiritimatiellota bacterium]
MAPATKTKNGKPNLLLIGVDSLVPTHMSAYGYPRLTTPHIDRFARDGVLFENTFCPHVPTTPGYGSMLTGRDCFGTNCVALRHKGPLWDRVKTLPEVLGENGYNTTIVGFTGNPASRGFQNYLNYSGWGASEDGRMAKAQKLNEVTVPEIERLAAEDKQPFFLMLRHMDPHSPYLPPAPFERIFYHGNECDPSNNSMRPVMEFKPFRDYFATWMPPGITDKDYVIAQYDGAVAYMDACLQTLFAELERLDLVENTIVVLNADHGETLYDHECWFDHHGTYDNTLRVPLIIRYPGKVPSGMRIAGYNQHKDLVPTLLELMEIETDLEFDGQSLMPLVRGEKDQLDTEFYITECTWMRKHGWRTPEWKLIVALEPDFHFKPPVELYNLVQDPEENRNLAEAEPDVVALLKKRMEAFIARREKEMGITNPMLTQGAWHGHPEVGPAFKSSQQAYDTLHIGDPQQAAKLQAKPR